MEEEEGAKQLEKREELLRNDPMNPEAIYGERIEYMGSKKRKHKSKREENKQLASREVFVYNKANQSEEVNTMERSIVLTRSVLDKLFDWEIRSKSMTKDTLREALEKLVRHTHDDNVPDMSTETLRGIQKDIKNSIQTEQNDVKRSLEGVETLMKETVLYHYHTLPPRYILEIEKNDKEMEDEGGDEEDDLDF